MHLSCLCMSPKAPNHHGHLAKYGLGQLRVDGHCLIFHSFMDLKFQLQFKYSKSQTAFKESDG